MPVVIILLILALVFGVGAVIEGLFWGLLITLALVVAAAVFGFNAVRGRTR
jgi:UPF0716 family protein affecting phage T7 exclusion